MQSALTPPLPFPSQFTAGELSRADGVGFVFSQRLPCAELSDSFPWIRECSSCTAWRWQSCPVTSCYFILSSSGAKNIQRIVSIFAWFSEVPRIVCEEVPFPPWPGWIAFLRMSQVNQRGQICMRAFAEIERLCERHSTLFLCIWCCIWRVCKNLQQLVWICLDGLTLAGQKPM